MSKLTVRELQRKLKKIVKDLPNLKEETLKRNESELLEIQALQHDDSVLSDGSRIMPLYAPYTEKKKGFATPDLYDTGDFREAFFLEVNKDHYEISSKDIKTGNLKAKYTDKIFNIAPGIYRKMAIESNTVILHNLIYKRI